MTAVRSCDGLVSEAQVEQQGSEGVPSRMALQWSCERSRPDALCFGSDRLDGWGTPVVNEATAIGGRFSAEGAAPVSGVLGFSLW